MTREFLRNSGEAVLLERLAGGRSYKKTRSGSVRRDYRGEDFHEEDSEGLLPVLHLSSNWLSSPSDPPY